MRDLNKKGKTCGTIHVTKREKNKPFEEEEKFPS